MVTDQNRDAILGLNESNFQLTEQSELESTPIVEKISVAQLTAEGGISISLVMDSSGSMEGSPMEDAKTAANTFIYNMTPLDRAAIIDFDTYVRVAQTFTSDQTALHDAVNSLIAEGWTNLFGAIYEGVSECAGEIGAKAVIIFTDGEAAGSQSHTMQAAIDHAIDTGIPVYTIALRTEDYKDVLETIANETGGDYYFAPSALDLAQIYADIKQKAQQQYVLSYYTHNLFDDSLRTVTVTATVNSQSGSGSKTYSVTNEPPFIRRTDQTKLLNNMNQPENEEIIIQVEVTDDQQVTDVRLFYRRIGESSYTQYQMSSAGSNLYEFTILATDVQEYGIEYYITASDGIFTSSAPQYEPDINPYQIPVGSNIAPQILHVPITASPLDTDILINAKIIDSSDNVDGAKLYYKSSTYPWFTESVDMTGNLDSYQATIPENAVTSEGTDYYIEAWDNYANISYHGTSESPHRINYGGDYALPSVYWDSGYLYISVWTYDNETGSKVEEGQGSFIIYDENGSMFMRGLLDFNSSTGHWGSEPIEFTHSGYFTLEVTINDIVETIPFIVMTGTQQGVISGEVKDAEGNIISGATVNLYFTPLAVPLGNLPSPVQSVQSTTQGYTFAATQYGHYLIIAEKGEKKGWKSVVLQNSSLNDIEITLSENNFYNLVDVGIPELRDSVHSAIDSVNDKLSEVSTSIDGHVKGEDIHNAVDYALFLAGAFHAVYKAIDSSKLVTEIHLLYKNWDIIFEEALNDITTLQVEYSGVYLLLEQYTYMTWNMSIEVFILEDGAKEFLTGVLKWLSASAWISEADSLSLEGYENIADPNILTKYFKRTDSGGVEFDFNDPDCDISLWEIWNYYDRMKCFIGRIPPEKKNHYLSIDQLENSNEYVTMLQALEYNPFSDFDSVNPRFNTNKAIQYVFDRTDQVNRYRSAQDHHWQGRTKRTTTQVPMYFPEIGKIWEFPDEGTLNLSEGVTTLKFFPTYWQYKSLEDKLTRLIAAKTAKFAVVLAAKSALTASGAGVPFVVALHGLDIAASVYLNVREAKIREEEMPNAWFKLGFYRIEDLWNLGKTYQKMNDFMKNETVSPKYLSTDLNFRAQIGDPLLELKDSMKDNEGNEVFIVNLTVDLVNQSDVSSSICLGTELYSPVQWGFWAFQY